MLQNISQKPKRGQLNIQSNYFQIKPMQELQKYLVNIKPEIKGQNKLQSEILRQIRPQLNTISPFFYYSDIIYSPILMMEEIDIEVNYQDKDWQIKITPIGSVTNISELLNILGRQFKIAQKGLKMQEIGRKYFNSQKKIEYPKHGLEIWPGFFSSVKLVDQRVFINVDLSYQFKKRKQNFLQVFKDGLVSGDKEKQKDEMIGCTVMTCYNKKMYRIDDIDFNMRVDHKFKIEKTGEQISYQEYYQKQWKLEIKDKNQFLIKHIDKKSQKNVYLIPEFCYMTGMTDKMRSDFNLNKDISETTKCPANERILKTKMLIDDLNNPENEKSFSILKDWLSSEPLKIQGEQLDPGSMVFGETQSGERTSFKIEQTPEFDRKTQTKMYNQPEIKQWGIFCPSRDKEICIEFLNNLQACMQQFNYPLQKPSQFIQFQEVIYLEGSKFNEFKKQLEDISQQVQLCVFLLPGPKKNGFNYKEIKQYLIQEKGVASQCVCLKTLQGKGLRSICNKILVQMCAKVGGIPWAISDMPFENIPTMLFGIDIVKKLSGKNKRQILAIAGTLNKSFSRYWSYCKSIPLEQELVQELAQALVQGLNNFKQNNKFFPQRLIFMMEGLSDSQRKTLLNNEIPGIRQALKQLEIPAKIIFICINKKVNEKFYLGDDLQKGLTNPQPGTLIHDGITQKFQDFYLISQKTNQGIATPTHFYILANDYYTQDPLNNFQIMQDIQDFCFKQCFLYYNWVGSIKIPAPVQYAHKLSSLVGDKFDFNFVPHICLGQKASLYFI